jgi:hypothetical protein
MPDAAKSGIIFLAVGFVMYLAWRQELGKYIGFATSGQAGTPTMSQAAASLVPSLPAAGTSASTAIQDMTIGNLTGGYTP